MKGAAPKEKRKQRFAEMSSKNQSSIPLYHSSNSDSNVKGSSDYLIDICSDSPATRLIRVAVIYRT